MGSNTHVAVCFVAAEIAFWGCFRYLILLVLILVLLLLFWCLLLSFLLELLSAKALGSELQISLHGITRIGSCVDPHLVTMPVIITTATSA